MFVTAKTHCHNIRAREQHLNHSPTAEALIMLLSKSLFALPHFRVFSEIPSICCYPQLHGVLEEERRGTRLNLLSPVTLALMTVRRMIVRLAGCML